jgi:hypothetical protein
MVMGVNYAKAVENLLRDGYAFVPVDAVAVANAMSATRMLMATIGENQRWMLTRLGEHEADVGLIRKSKVDGYDEKSYFHFARDLPILLEYAGVSESAKQSACLETVERLQLALRDLALGVVVELQKRNMLCQSTYGLTYSTFRASEPYNTSVLRYLQYPDVKNQTGAKDHYDKGLLSIHLGDDGGELLARDKAGNWVAVSPPSGMALVFFGVKILSASNGELLPLRHQSTTLAGKVRTAMVLFAHADVGHQVVNAEESFHAFYKARE